MVKLVDMPDLGSGAARRVGSSPILGRFPETFSEMTMSPHFLPVVKVLYHDMIGPLRNRRSDVLECASFCCTCYQPFKDVCQLKSSNLQKIR